MHDFLIFGHRGSPRRFPENTVDSFEEALRSGADGFETDLRLLADGVAVLFHDDELKGEIVESLRSDQVHAQRVSDLARFSGRGTMVLEVKRGGWEDKLIEEIGSWSNFVVASFDHALIASLAKRRVKFPLGLTFEGTIHDLPSYARRIGATWIFPSHRHTSEALVKSVGDMRVVPWTPNRPHEWQRLAGIGCAGIITDVPGEAVEWRSKGLRTEV